MLSPHEIREVCQAGKDSDPAWYRIHRRLSIHVTARLLETRITLRHISTLMLSLGVAGAALNASPHLLVNAIGWACLYGAFLLDKVDGEVARYRGEQSVVGILLDRFHHRMIEPLLFLAVGWRVFAATHSPLPLIAALAAMLAANIVEETQHLPAYIAAKHARETRAWPVSGRGPSARWKRVEPWMRSLKTFRTFITVLPLVAAAEVLEALTPLPVTTWLLVTSAVALWVYAIFQACYYVAGRLEADIDSLTRQLPSLPGDAPAARDERPRRSAALTVEPADAEPARAGMPERREGPGPLVVLLLLGLLAGNASAATYYVDGSSAQCSISGPGTLTEPYCTISAAIAARGTAGNTILVQPGTYRETITFPASGTESAPIVLRANGSGVIIDGADDFSTPSEWTQVSGDVWLAANVSWLPGQVFADGARLAASTDSPSSLPPGTFRHVLGDGLYVNAGGHPSLHAVLVGRRASAFVLSNRSWITIQGFTVTRTDERSFRITSASSDISILDCTVTFSNKYGIYLNDAARVRIAGNAVTDHNGHGIILTAGSNFCTIENNESARNALPDARSANGLYLYGSIGNTVRSNRWHHNQDSGQHFQSGSNDNLSYDNVSWSNGDHGFDHVGASGTRHFNDVAYGNFKDGFSMEGASPGTQITNCIAVDNGLTTGEYDLWVDPESSSGFVSNDNIFWNSTSQKPIKYITTQYATLAAYQAASGQDSRSLQINPLFVNAPAGDFRLLAGSPAIDNGNASSPEWPATDASGSARFDDPSATDTGLGPITFSDRGAHEYRPAGLPPVAVLVASPGVSIAPALVTLDASGSSDPEGGALSYRFDFGDGTSAGPQPSPSVTHAYSAGTFTATVTVTDVGQMGDSASAALIVAAPDRAPVVVAPATVTASEGGEVTVDVTVTDPDGDPVLHLSPDLSSLPAGNNAVFTPAADLSGGQLVWHPTFADSGSYVVTFVAGNALADTASTVLHIVNDDRPPMVVAPATARFATGNPFSMNVTASDPDGDPIGSLIASLANLPAGHSATFTPAADSKSGVFAWTPASGDTGSYVLAFVATNAHTGSATTLLTVTPPNQLPTAVLAVTPRTGNAPLKVTADASASSDPGGGPLAYRFDFGDGVVVGPQASPVASHTYGAGTWTLTASVIDLDGAVSMASAGVTVAATGPGLNLVSNPSFEWNTTGWRRFSAVSLVRATGGFVGTRHLRVAGPANLQTFGIDDSTNCVQSTPAKDTRYRFGAWVRSSTARGAARLQIRELAGNTPIGDVVSSSVALTPEWQFLSVEWVARASGSTLDFQVVDQPLAPGEVFEVDNVSIHVLAAPESLTPVTTSDTPSEGPTGHDRVGGFPPGAAPVAPTPAPAAPTAVPAAPVEAAVPEAPTRFSVWIESGMATHRATLRFTTTLPGPVRIELYDLSGRRLRRLFDEPHVAPGLHSVTLDGRSDQGEQLVSGVYFYRVQAHERSATGRFVLVR